jgi:site-specific DNA recombinase
MAVWLGYRRVSHVGGRSGDRFHSPSEQADVIRAWAKARGERVEMLVPELDESGGRADRPILTAAVERVERGKARGIVVAYLSRASRSVRHLLELWDRIEAAGGQVIAVAENVDTSTPAGRLTRTMLAAIAEHELDLHRDRFEQLRRSATERGIWQRRQTPRGYRRDPTTRRLVPDKRADEVRQAFHARATGESPGRIAERLGMTPSGVRQLLSNRVYLGELRVGEHVNAAAHQPLVDLDTWEVAQRTLPRPSRSKREPALLAGLARCAGCGHLLTRGGSSARAVYVCPRNHSGGRCPEPAAVTVAVLDAHVERIALAELEQLAVTATDGTGIEQARSKLAAAERELTAYLESISAADVGTEAFAAGARSRRDAVDAAHDQLQGELARRPAIPLTGTGGDAWQRLDGYERNALLRALLSAVVVKRAGGRGARVTLGDRVRVLAHGAPIRLPTRRGGEAMGIAPIPLPNADDPGVLGLPTGEDLLKRPRRAGKMRRSRRLAVV